MEPITAVYERLREPVWSALYTAHRPPCADDLARLLDEPIDAIRHTLIHLLLTDRILCLNPGEPHPRRYQALR